MKLFEINASLRKLLEEGFVCDEETGEVLFDGADGLNALTMAREEKILGTCKVIKELQDELDAYEEQRKALAKRMMARAAAFEKKIAWLKGYLRDQTTEGEKLRDGVISLSWKRSSSVEISVAVESLPACYVQAKQSYSADKAALKAALEAGQEISGVCLVEKMSPVLR